MKVFEWPDEYKRDLQNKPLDKNDPDRAVNMRGLEKFQCELRDETNFTPPHVWCLAGASKEMSGIDSNDIRQLTNKAATWGRYVRDESEQHAYVNELSKRFGVSAGQILSEIKVGDEDEDAFIERLKGVLASRLQPMHAFRTATSHIMRVWDRQTQDIYEFAIAEKPRILATISAMSGKDPLQFVKDEVGEPAFLDGGVRPTLFGNQAQRRRWLKRAFTGVPGSPLALFLLKYVLQLGFLDGKPGLIYCWLQAVQLSHTKAKLHELERAKARRYSS